MYLIASSVHAQDGLVVEEEEECRKSVNLELVFGYHWKAGTGHKVNHYLSWIGFN